MFDLRTAPKIRAEAPVATNDTAPTRVLVVDDNPMVRRGLTFTLMDALPKVDVVEAGDATTAIDAARRHRPHLVILDLHMPGSMPARELCTQLRALLADAKIAIVVGLERIDDARECLAAGASGCLLKDASELEITTAVRAILRGEIAIDDRVAQRLARALVLGTAADGVHLTNRERDVLYLLADGCSNRTIARRLLISEATVKGYVTSLLEKLDASSRLEAVVHAARAGMLEPMRFYRS